MMGAEASADDIVLAVMRVSRNHLDAPRVVTNIAAMASVFTKLNLKTQRELLILNAPESFDSELAALEGVTVHRHAKALKSIEFGLAFGTKLSEVEAFAKLLAKKAAGDAVIWFAYPKGSSKRYSCEFNRDTGWAALGALGLEPVRQIAIDEDWSALRFRNVAFIKTMTRSTLAPISKAGAAKAKR